MNFRKYRKNTNHPKTIIEALSYTGKLAAVKQSSQLNVNLNEDVRRVFDEIEDATGLRDQAVTKALFRALVQYWDSHKRLTVPFEIADSTGKGPGR
jgi:hypothetical protein